MRTMNFNTGIVWAAGTLAAVSLSGCFETSERSQSNSERTQIVERHPTPDGGYVEKTTEYIAGEKTKDITSKADVDWAGAVSKGIGQAATGDWIGLAVTAGTALAAGGAAVVKHREAVANKKDADEAWDKLLAEKDKSDG